MPLSPKQLRWFFAHKDAQRKAGILASSVADPAAGDVRKAWEAGMRVFGAPIHDPARVLTKPNPLYHGSENPVRALLDSEASGAGSEGSGMWWSDDRGLARHVYGPHVAQAELVKAEQVWDEAYPTKADRSRLRQAVRGMQLPQNQRLKAMDAIRMMRVRRQVGSEVQDPVNNGYRAVLGVAAPGVYRKAGYDMLTHREESNFYRTEINSFPSAARTLRLIRKQRGK